MKVKTLTFFTNKEKFFKDFKNNLPPSTRGCKRPKPTFFGPIRYCIAPIIKRSTKVKKATAKRTKTIFIKNKKKEIKKYKAFRLTA